MHCKFKQIIKQLIPPIVFQLRKNDRLCLTGNYVSWDQANAASAGYDSKIILEKTKEALLKVKKGEAVYERDSVLFDEIQYAWPLLAGLMWAAAQHSGSLNVLDFGGSLGSTYFQNRVFLAYLPKVRWSIVEQPDHVEAGKKYFQNDYLKFYSSIGECLAHTQPNVVVFSSVLQYLEHPYKILDEISTMGCKNVIIDRTPFWYGSSDRLCVQHVPPCIYKASYPSWIFSQSRFTSELLKLGYRLVAEFENKDRLAGPIPFSYKGMILEK